MPQQKMRRLIIGLTYQSGDPKLSTFELMLTGCRPTVEGISNEKGRRKFIDEGRFGVLATPTVSGTDRLLLKKATYHESVIPNPQATVYGTARPLLFEYTPSLEAVIPAAQVTVGGIDGLKGRRVHFQDIRPVGLHDVLVSGTQEYVEPTV